MYDGRIGDPNDHSQHVLWSGQMATGKDLHDAGVTAWDSPGTIDAKQAAQRAPFYVTPSGVPSSGTSGVFVLLTLLALATVVGGFFGYRWVQAELWPKPVMMGALLGSGKYPAKGFARTFVAHLRAEELPALTATYGVIDRRNPATCDRHLPAT